jgi:hypothetical protein
MFYYAAVLGHTNFKGTMMHLQHFLRRMLTQCSNDVWQALFLILLSKALQEPRWHLCRATAHLPQTISLLQGIQYLIGTALL